MWGVCGLFCYLGHSWIETRQGGGAITRITWPKIGAFGAAFVKPRLDSPVSRYSGSAITRPRIGAFIEEKQ